MNASNLRVARALATAFAAVALLAPHTARADGPKTDVPAADDNDRVRSLFRRGAAAFQAGKVEEARQLLLEAWAIRQTYDVASSLAQIELELKRYADAASHLDFCIRNFAPVESEQTLLQVRKAFADAKTRVASVSVSTSAKGAEIFVDRVGVGTAPLSTTVFVEPGSHQFGARLDSASAEQALNTEAGKEYSVELDLGDEARQKPAVTAASEPSGLAASTRAASPANTPSKNYAPAIVVGSVGAATLVTSVVLLLEASHKDSLRDDRIAQIPGTNRCGAGTPYSAMCAPIASLDSDARTFRTLSFVGFGATAVAGVATYFLWPRSSEHDQVGFDATVLPSSAGLNVFTGVHGAF